MAFRFDEQIVGFEITVDDLPSVQMLHAEHDLRHVLLRPILGQSAKDLDKGCTVATVEIFHHEVEVVFTRKSPVKFGNEIALALPHHDSSLSLDIGDLVLGNHIPLLQYLNGVVVSRRLLLREIYTAECTLTNGLDDFEVLDRSLYSARLRYS